MNANTSSANRAIISGGRPPSTAVSDSSRHATRARFGTSSGVTGVAQTDPWVRAVIATPAHLEGLSRSSELRG